MKTPPLQPHRKRVRRRAELRAYAALFSVNLHNQVAYLGEWALRGVFLAMILFVFLQLWRATYAGQGAGGTGVIGGFTLPQMLWYLAFTESIILSRPGLNRLVDAEVRTGDITYTLLRPYAYGGYRLMAYLAERALRFATLVVLGAALAWLYVGPVPLRPVDLLVALGALFLAALLDFLGAFGIGLLAFWTEDTSSIGLIYDRLVMLLGGMLLPLELFPEPLGAIARVLPFATLIYGPARLAFGAAPDGVWLLLGRQALFLAAGALGVALLYRRAFRRIALNGG
jgi:viologen exporter family transport system permease protein